MQPVLSLDTDKFLFFRQDGIHQLSGTVRVINVGKGILLGSLISSANWIQIVRTKIETPYLHILTFYLAVDLAPVDTTAQGTITITTNGGTRTISIELKNRSFDVPLLSLTPRRIFLRETDRGSVIKSSITIRNTRGGMLSGTITSQMPWIQPVKKTFQISDAEEILLYLSGTKAPDRPLCNGYIDIVSNGGQDRIFVTISFAKKKAGEKPCLTLSDSRLTIRQEKKNQYQDRIITIRNTGTGTLTGTITSTVRWISYEPSQFSIQDAQRIRIRIRHEEGHSISLSGTLTIRSNGGSGYISITVYRSVSSPHVRLIHRKNRRIQLYDEFGIAVRLTATGKSGGEGEIFLIDGKDTICAKIFHQNRRTSALFQKIEAMVSEPPRGDIYEHVTWPASLLFDTPNAGSFAGFVMQRINTNEFFPLHNYYDPEDRISLPCSHAADKQRLMLYKIAQELAFITGEIHAAGHCIGDLRETNIFASVSGSIILIDCDSFQIRHRNTNKIFYSKVATGEYLPPELLDIDFSKGLQDRYYADLYALSVLIFKLVMEGVHPFQAKGKMLISAPTTIDKVRIGCFSFAKPRAGISPPDYAPDYRLIPGPVANLFSRCFIDGYRIPSRRPSAEEWCRVLQTVLYGMNKTGYTTSELKRSNHPFLSTKPGSESTGITKKEEKIRLPVAVADVTLGDTGQERCYTSTHEPMILSNKLFSSGNHSLYEIQGNSLLVATIWTALSVPENIWEKIQVMVNNPPPDTLLDGKLAWPISMIYKDPGCTIPIGYTTHAINRTRYFEIHTCYDPADRIVRFTKEFSFRHLIATGANLAGVIASLHAGGHRTAGGMHVRSLLVAADCSVNLINCVNFQIKDPATGILLPPGPLQPDMTPPEWRDTRYQGDTDYYSVDLFALGVLLFRLLMDGVHPFMIAPLKGAEPLTPAERIQKGLYPYTERDDISPPRFAPPYSRIPPVIRDLFDACFLTGQNYQNRPSALLWHTTLNQVFHDIIQCNEEKTHWYMPDSDSFPLCIQESPGNNRVASSKEDTLSCKEEIPVVSEGDMILTPIYETNRAEDVMHLYHQVSALLLHLTGLPVSPELLFLPAPKERKIPITPVIYFPESLAFYFEQISGTRNTLAYAPIQFRIINLDTHTDENDLFDCCDTLSDPKPNPEKLLKKALHEEEERDKMSIAARYRLDASTREYHEERNNPLYHSTIHCRHDEKPGAQLSILHQISLPPVFPLQIQYKKADQKRIVELMLWLCNDREIHDTGKVPLLEDTRTNNDFLYDLTLIDEFYWYCSRERQKGMMPFVQIHQEDEHRMPDTENEQIPMTTIPVMVVPFLQDEREEGKTGNCDSSLFKTPLLKRVQEHIRNAVKKKEWL